MESSEECRECIYNQAKRMLDTLNIHGKERTSILEEVTTFLHSVTLTYSPMEISQYVNTLIQNRSGVSDPYYREKNRANMLAKQALPVAKRLIERSTDPIYASIKVSIAGNIIDYGIANRIPDLKKTLEHIFSKEPQINDYNKLHNALNTAEKIAILADNAGEIIFDLLMAETIEEHLGNIKEIKIVGKKNPFLNDITAAELSLLVREINKPYHIHSLFNAWGQDYVESIKGLLDQVDVIISKGQGNFEIFYGRYNRIYYMFLVKCPIVGKEIDVENGNYIIKYY